MRRNRDGLKMPGIYWWVGVSWKSASMKRAWRLLKVRLRGFSVIREADKEIHLPNGTQIWLRTADNLSSLAGEGLRGAVLDEFTLMDERACSCGLAAQTRLMKSGQAGSCRRCPIPSSNRVRSRVR